VHSFDWQGGVVLHFPLSAPHIASRTCTKPTEWIFAHVVYVITSNTCEQMRYIFSLGPLHIAYRWMRQMDEGNRVNLTVDESRARMRPVSLHKERKKDHYRYIG
jgi:hypothetical protein